MSGGGKKRFGGYVHFLVSNDARARIQAASTWAISTTSCTAQSPIASPFNLMMTSVSFIVVVGLMLRLLRRLLFHVLWIYLLLICCVSCCWISSSFTANKYPALLRTSDVKFFARVTESLGKLDSDRVNRRPCPFNLLEPIANRSRWTVIIGHLLIGAVVCFEQKELTHGLWRFDQFVKFCLHKQPLQLALLVRFRPLHFNEGVSGGIWRWQDNIAPQKGQSAWIGTLHAISSGWGSKTTQTTWTVPDADSSTTCHVYGSSNSSRPLSYSLRIWDYLERYTN